MSPFEQYRRLVFQDRTLQIALDAAADSQVFADLAAQQARDHGLDLSAADVLAALQRARQSWLLRMLP